MGVGNVARTASDDLNLLFDAVAREPTAWEFFALLRGVEQARPDAPRIGTALDPAIELIELRHMPSADFPRTTLAAFERGGRRPSVASQHLGLTGSMGPLPAHLTELAVFERAAKGPSPFADFLDMVSARMLQAFYRAWSSASPTAQADRPNDDRFATYLGATSGATNLRFAAAAERPPFDGDGFHDWRRLAYGGHLAALRSAGAVVDLLSHLLERPVGVTEAVGRWRAIPEDALSRIGTRRGRHAQLGGGATLGRRFFAVEWNVAFTAAARSMADLERFLPGGDANQLLTEAAAAALPAHLDWEARVEIDEAAIAPARLGGASADGAKAPGARLGLTSWIKPRGRAVKRTDLRLAGARPARVAA